MTPLDHLMVAPIVFPAIIASLTMLLMRQHRTTALAVSLGGAAAMLVVAIALFAMAQDDAIRSYALGDWPAPFGGGTRYSSGQPPRDTVGDAVCGPPGA